MSDIITILVPVYNEEDGITRLVDTFTEYIETTCSVPLSVLLINDGSTDRSLEKIKEACETNSSFNYISLAENRGLSTAIKAGFDYVTTPWVGYIDADLQTTPFDFELLFAKMNEADAVVGYRQNRQDTTSKRIQSKIANWIRRQLINDGIIDTGCPLKIVKTEVAQKLPFFNGMHRFIPALVQLVGGTVIQVPIQHFERIHGQSKFNLLNRSIGPLHDAFGYRWMKSRMIDYNIQEQSE